MFFVAVLAFLGNLVKRFTEIVLSLTSNVNIRLKNKVVLLQKTEIKLKMGIDTRYMRW